MKTTILQGDCLKVMRTLADNSVDSIVTDPPYGLRFMGKRWDHDVPSVDVWAECLRVLKPGGHLLAFAGTRTQHRMAVRIEDAGFEIRDMIAWVYGSGFPKSRDIGKDIDYRGGAQLSWFGPWLREWREKRGISQSELAKHFPSKSGGKTGRVSNFELGVRLPTADDFNLICQVLKLPFASIKEAERDVIGTKPGDPERFRSFAEQDGNERRTFNSDITAAATDAARQWQGWGTALKPALEPITVARKPLVGTVAANVLACGTGALNIDACRVDGEAMPPNTGRGALPRRSVEEVREPRPPVQPHELGRWPANVIHDGSDDVLAAFPQAPGQQGPISSTAPSAKTSNVYGAMRREGESSADSDNRGAVGFKMKPGARRIDAGSAARFFYCAKASKTDRGEGNNHPTVKPTDLMRYLCRLVTPPGGVVLDPFMGSGSTLKAAELEGFHAIGIELSPDYIAIARSRIAADAPLFAEVA